MTWLYFRGSVIEFFIKDLEPFHAERLKGKGCEFFYENFCNLCNPACDRPTVWKMTLAKYYKLSFCEKSSKISVWVSTFSKIKGLFFLGCCNKSFISISV